MWRVGTCTPTWESSMPSTARQQYATSRSVKTVYKSKRQRWVVKQTDTSDTMTPLPTIKEESRTAGGMGQPSPADSSRSTYQEDNLQNYEKFRARLFREIPAVRTSNHPLHDSTMQRVLNFNPKTQWWITLNIYQYWTYDIIHKH